MKTVTQGEKLFYLIRNRVLETLTANGRKWSDLKGLLESAGGKVEFEQYIKGAMAVHSMRRLLRFWEDEHDACSEVMRVKVVTAFIRDEVFVGLPLNSSGELARSVIAAHSVSRKKIGGGVRSSILKKTLQPQCYLCNHALDTQAKEGDAHFLTLEHLWPTSVGGDSIEENLLPACLKCQDVTKDTMSWEWFNLQNLVFPREPSEGALTSVDWKTRYAIHFYQALMLAERTDLTLKDAFLKIGHVKNDVKYRKTGNPITFFDLQTH